MSDQQLQTLEQAGQAESRLTIYSPQSGTVVEKLAVEGDYVKAGDPIYRIAELSTVWLMLKLYPEDATRVRFGQRVEAVVQSLPGETQYGRIAFIDPKVDPQTRTVGVRVELSNPQGRLRPYDYARATIRLQVGPQGEVYDQELAGKWISPMHPQVIADGPGECPICGMPLVPTTRYGFADQPVPPPTALHVPRSAVLMAGEHSVVYVEAEPGRFELRPVKLGPVLRDKIVILEGVAAGEQVATAGNFLIDSQMQLAGKPSLIDAHRFQGGAQMEGGTPMQVAPQTAGPLKLADRPTSVIAGPAGEQLEQLYTIYFEAHRALAADRQPPAAVAQRLHLIAKELSASEMLSPDTRQQLTEIAKSSEHLSHQDLEAARTSFKPISHAVIQLAAGSRGAEGPRRLVHFYCPMVPEGGGDWLQADDGLLNPYFGSQMLRCGEMIGVLEIPTDQPPQGDAPATTETPVEQPDRSPAEDR
jgi:Cu(I)/Ag(I) efflux system membrane fusion protein